MNFKKTDAERWANVIAILGLIVAVIFNVRAVQDQNKTLQETQRIASADYVLKISQELEAPKYTKITMAFENGSEFTPIISKGGSFTVEELDDYIGNFDTIGDLVEAGVIDKDMAYQEFSYDVTKVWCNQDVQAEIKSDRASDSTSIFQNEYWNGLEYISKYFMQKDNETCIDYDKQ